MAINIDYYSHTPDGLVLDIQGEWVSRTQIQGLIRQYQSAISRLYMEKTARRNPECCDEYPECMHGR